MIAYQKLTGNQYISRKGYIGSKYKLDIVFC